MQVMKDKSHRPHSVQKYEVDIFQSSSLFVHDSTIKLKIPTDWNCPLMFDFIVPDGS